ncbi:MAG: nuclear transport factor 2 family protein, partial [Cyanobacteria bacterium J083]
LLSWSQTDNDLVAETITEITGVKASPERVVRLQSTIKSRQYFRNNQLVRQDILEETTKVTSGDNPPQIKVLSPKTVKVGEKFNFDVIVTQPLNDDLLLGTAIEEPISRQLYLEPSTLELERLSAGGIYKIITAPLSPDKRWISAVIVGGEGITLITQRVIVEQ